MGEQCKLLILIRRQNSLPSQPRNPLFYLLALTLSWHGYFFEVEYGVRPWEVVFVPGVHLVSIPMFHIVRYDVKKVEEEE